MNEMENRVQKDLHNKFIKKLQDSQLPLSRKLLSDVSQPCEFLIGITPINQYQIPATTIKKSLFTFKARFVYHKKTGWKLIKPRKRE